MAKQHSELETFSKEGRFKIIIQAKVKKRKVIGENAPLPAFSERFALIKAMLEALGLDLPCLGRRIFGVKDILQHEELMFDPKDEKDIVRKISRFFSDEQLSNHIAELCR